MAESLNIHFSDASWDQVSAWLDHHVHLSHNRTWSFPQSDYLILIYEFPNPQDEIEPKEFDALCDRLGMSPASSLLIEIRRSKGDSAMQAAHSLVGELLQAFNGIAYDVDGTTVIAP